MQKISTLLEFAGRCPWGQRGVWSDLSMPAKKKIAAKKPGRPRGSKNEASKRTKGACNLSLDLEVIAWLDDLRPEKSAGANRILRAAMDSGLDLDAIEAVLRKNPASP